MVSTDYVKQAQDLLDSMGVTFSVELIGSACPKFCEDATKGKDMGAVNTYPRKTHIHGKQYRATFERRKKVSEADGKPVYSSFDRGPVFVVDFWNSYADEEIIALGTPKYRRGETSAKYPLAQVPSQYPPHALTMRQVKPRVTPYDVLACLTKSDPGTFEEFASDYGYDSDSRRAEDVYRGVVEEWRKVRGFFTEAEIERLQEVS